MPASDEQDKTANPATGFMTSFLQFLQVENVCLSASSEDNDTCESQEQGDSQSLSLPALSNLKRKRFVDSDQDSDDERKQNKVRPVEVVKPFIAVQKASESIVHSALKIMKKSKGHSAKAKRSFGKKVTIEQAKVQEMQPRRSLRGTAQKKARVETSTPLVDQGENSEEDDTGDYDLADSDSDPVWTPAKETSDDDGKNHRRGRRHKKRHSTAPTFSESDGSSSEDTEKTSQVNAKDTVSNKPAIQASSQVQEKPSRLQPVRSPVQPLEPKLNLVQPKPSPVQPLQSKPSPVQPQPNLQVQPNSAGSSGTQIEGTKFKSGDYVVSKADLNLEFPPLWRVDGKTLLQKFETFEKDGETLYRNSTTFSGWMPGSRLCYLPAPVKCLVQTRKESVVKFLQDEVVFDEKEFVETTAKMTAGYRDNFEVVIQALLSQELDSKFLGEVYGEKDEYFLSNIKTIDDLTEERKCRLVAVAQWSEGARNSVETWPCLKVTETVPNKATGNLCTACGKSAASTQFEMSGQPYSNATFQESQPSDCVDTSKNFLVCSKCSDQLQLYHKVAHQKYLMHAECAKRVREKRSIEAYDITQILNDLLADEAWIAELFIEVQRTWAKIDILDRPYVKKLLVNKAIKP